MTTQYWMLESARIVPFPVDRAAAPTPEQRLHPGLVERIFIAGTASEIILPNPANLDATDHIFTDFGVGKLVIASGADSSSAMIDAAMQINAKLVNRLNAVRQIKKPDGSVVSINVPTNSSVWIPMPNTGTRCRGMLTSRCRTAPWADGISTSMRPRRRCSPTGCFVSFAFVMRQFFVV